MASNDTLRLADRLHSVAIHLLRSIRSGDARSGLSAPRLSALSVIIYRGPITLTELAGLEQVTLPTMTRLVQALEADGLVRRRSIPADRRSTELSATARGKKALEKARTARLAALAGLLESLTPSETAALESTVDALEGKLGRL